MQYSVAFKNISENDQLVLRLIFSLSAKARGRDHAYCLFESDAGMEPDICIAHAPTPELRTSLSTPYTIWLDVDEQQPDTTDYTIRKPLIASRVLNVLDSYIRAQQSVNDQPEVAPTVVEVITPAETTSSDEEELEFSISEEEASQLAIVDDESLSNPANLTSPETIAPANGLKASNPDATNSITSFVVSHDNDMETSARTFDNQREQEQPVARPRALVVDDSPSVRKQIELELELFHVDADFAESVADAQAKLEDHHYDVAFLDVVLPDGDGFSICREIKTGESTTAVIILTGKATAADKIRGSMAGCDAYLVKPVGRLTFQNTVCNYLQLREQLEVIHG